MKPGTQQMHEIHESESPMVVTTTDSGNEKKEHKIHVVMRFEIYVAIKNYMLVFPHEEVAEKPYLHELRMDILYNDDSTKIGANHLYGLLDLYLKKVCDGYFVMSSLDWILAEDESMWAGSTANRYLIRQGSYDVPYQTYRDRSWLGDDFSECYDLASKKFAYEMNYLPDVITALNKNQTLITTFEELLGDEGHEIFLRLQAFHTRLITYIRHEEMKGYLSTFGKDGRYSIPLDELRLV